MKSESQVHIIGGGVIGLCSAYYLTEAGYEVTVIDASSEHDGTSYGNAGMIVPSHFIPLAAPGVISKGIRWMFDAKSPFYIRPRMSLDLMRWLWQFYKSCNSKHVERSIELLRDYNLFSKQLYGELADVLGSDVDFQEKGLIMLCQSKNSLQEETEIGEQAQRLGLKVRIIDTTEITKLNNGLVTHALGGVYYEDDASVYSNQFMKSLRKLLKSNGVNFQYDIRIIDVQRNKTKVNGLVTSDDQLIHIDQVVLAGGAWSKVLLKKMGIPLLMQDGKGYSITLSNHVKKPVIPCILSEAKVAMTPMNQNLRITGTLEISNLEARINRKRVQGFLEAVPKYFPDINPDPNPPKESIWTGYRPCSPDGIPYMGFAPGLQNVLVATGHAMMGMSLGPASGKLVADMIQREKTSIPTQGMGLDRF